MSLTKLIIDCETGAQKEVPLSAEEIAEYEAKAIEAEARRTAEETAAAAKLEALASAEAKLASLGLTTDEINALKGN